MIHSETYRIRNYEADPNGNLWLHSLANYLQDAADRNSTDLGFGLPQLLEQGLSWVLHRMRIDIHRWPQAPEEVIVTTNPSGVERIYVYRDFNVYDNEQNLLISASSTWLVFDLKKRKLTAPSPELKKSSEPYQSLPHHPRADQKYPTLPISWQYQTQITARHIDIDQNQHVNNSVYFHWLLEPLPTEFLLQNSCVSMDITFKAECTRGEVVYSRCEPLDHNQFIHRLENERGGEIASALSSWGIEVVNLL